MHREKFDIIIELEKSKLIFNILIGTLLPIILLTIILSSIYLNNLQKIHINDLKELKENILLEKKIFLRGAVERTISEINYTREEIAKRNKSKNLTQDELDALSIEKISESIRSLRLTKENYYIWVNKILNYEGGEKYAIRLIHPNLRDTEGMFLSTNIKDVSGTKPYEVELEGMKKEGELYYDYYFKKLNSEKIAHKLSFAKLYKPFNWVIATGIYLDDFDALIKQKSLKIEDNYNEQKRLSIIVSLLSIFFLLIIILYFIYKIKKMILSYEMAINTYIKKIESMATTDPLTGLYNRLELDSIYRKELNKAKRYNHEFSIIMIDIDFFKSVNDNYGHLVGDSVLKELSNILKSSIRSVDMLGRWGGEEFLIICSNTNLTGALELAEHLRSAVASYHFEGVGTKTCSFGVSSYSQDDTQESMIKRADNALYCAKKEGRNRVQAELETQQCS